MRQFSLFPDLIFEEFINETVVANIQDVLGCFLLNLIKNQLMAKVLSVGRQFLKKCDLFASTQFLRFKSDAETKTLTGGFISLSVVVFLATQFATMILDTFGKVVITSVTDSTQAAEPPPIFYSTHDNGKKFMLGIQLWHYDITTGPRYFDIVAVNAVQIQGVYSNQSIQITLEPCTKQHWGGLPEIDTLYDRVAMSTWLCLPLNRTFTVAGNYISEIQKSLDITISKCNNATDPSRPCATPAEIEAFLRADSQLYWTPYFMNPLLNPQSDNYLTYYLEDKWYVMSGVNYGTEMYIYSDDFQITTDESILPFTSQRLDTGPIVNSVFPNVYDLDNSTDVYCFINFFRAPDSVIISREFQKILDSFAYVGGLLGSFLLILIIIVFYNEGSFELNFASALYLPQEGSPTTFRKYNLLYYILQGVYMTFRILGFRLDWKCTQFFYGTRKEMLKQLDVMFLFRKIHILENGLKLLLTKPQLRGLMLQHELSVTEARGIRKEYGIKLDVARMVKHKMQKRKREQGLACNNSKQSMANTVHKIGSSELELDDVSKKGDKSTSLKEIETNRDKMEEQINLDDYGSDSESSGAEEEHLSKQEELLEDLYQLQRDCMENNEISMNIYDNMDPRIKALLEKVSDIKFQSSMKLSQARRRPKQQAIKQQVSEEDGSFELSPAIMKRVKVGNPERKKNVGKNKSDPHIKMQMQNSVDDKFDFDFNEVYQMDN